MLSLFLPPNSFWFSLKVKYCQERWGFPTTRHTSCCSRHTLLSAASGLPTGLLSRAGRAGTAGGVSRNGKSRHLPRTVQV